MADSNNNLGNCTRFRRQLHAGSGDAFLKFDATLERKVGPEGGFRLAM